MTTLQEIRKRIEKSTSPFALYDDDADGLSSFLQIKRKFPKLEGMPVKGKPEVPSEPFLTKIHEHCSDLILVLDKPKISEEFLQKANLPIIWIDHHTPPESTKGTRYYNPRTRKNYKNTAPPVAYWVYQMLKSKELLWIAQAGIIGDYHDFLPKEFIKNYRHLLPEENLSIDEIAYNSPFGEIICIFDFALKGKNSDVHDSIIALSKVKEPEEILNQSTPEGKYLYQRYLYLKKEYDSLLNQAIAGDTGEGPFIFIYPNKKFSFSQHLASELNYKIRKEFIMVGRDKGDEVIFSIRSKTIDLRPIVKSSLEGVEGYGGGHPFACGAHIQKHSLLIFLDNFLRIIKN
jgi:single-stranded DNA-specific DHH superfamily exonuclease